MIGILLVYWYIDWYTISILLVYYICLAAPSPELVKRVRELYHRNSSDVRFLIPVLHGLQKVTFKHDLYNI